MKCEDCLAIIEEYFDAELAERESQQVAEHLTACSLCNEVYESLQQEQQLYVHYQRDVEITSALWQGVQASIKSEAAHQAERTPSVSLFDRARQFFGEAFHAPRFSPALAAMLVVAAIGATVLVMNYVNSHSNSTNVAGTIQNGNVATPSNDANANHSSQTGVVAGSNSNTNPKDAPEKDNHEIVAPEKNQLAKNSNEAQMLPVKNATTPRQMPVAKAAEIKPNASAEALLRDAEQKYLAAIAILQRDFDKRRSKLDKTLVAKLDTALSSIDRTIAETRKAVRQNPDDPIAVQYMLTAYAKKVEVLKDMTAD